MNTNARNKRLTTLVSLALLIAIEVVLSRFFSIRTPVVRIGFGFVPIAVAGMMFGPVGGTVVAGVGDLLGATLFPSGAFHPGFTLSTALGGLVYGLLLHQKEGTPEWSHAKMLVRIAIAAGINCFAIALCLNTVWLTQLLGKGFMVLMAPRIVKEAVMFVVDFVVINLLHVALVQPLMRRQVRKG